MSKIKSALIITGAITIIIFIFFTRTPYWTALTKSRDHFIENTLNKRVLYEQGAEEYADKIAACLQTAINIIEEKQYKPYSKNFKVYVCNSQKSFGEYCAVTSLYPIRGMVLFGDVYISPGAFSFMGKDTHKESLLHEMSHLHMRQQLGFFKERKIPQWFREGLADYVSGTGGEGIEESEAVNFILTGRCFILEEEGTVFGSFQKEVNDLSGPMYHQQVKTFVTYLAESEPQKFKSLVLKIEDGEPFNESFKETLDSDIQGKWIQFISQLGS